MLWIGCHCPDLPLDRIQRRLPEGVAPALAVVSATGTQRRILLANAAAQAGGVQSGQSVASALALQPGLLLFERDPRDEAAAVTDLALAALRYTPSVVRKPDGFLAEVSGSLRLFGGQAALRARLAELVRAAGLRGALDWATTPGAAWLLARQAGADHDATNASVNASANDGAGACGKGAQRTAGAMRDRGAAAAIGPVPENDDPPPAAGIARLDALPCTLLEQAVRHAEVLGGLGCRTIGDLRRLPRAGLARRFGPELLAELDRARGRVPDPQTWLVAPERFGARLELLARIEHVDGVLHATGRLLTQLDGWLAARHAALVALTLTLVHDERHRQPDPPPTRLTLRLAEPHADVVHLAGLLRERLARQPLAAPVEEIVLEVDQVVTRGADNRELFASAPSAAAGLQRLIEKLAARLGSAAVQRLRIVADHRPERACQVSPADAVKVATATTAATAATAVTAANAAKAALATTAMTATATMTAAISAGAAPGAIADRPAWLLDTPRPLRVRQHKPVHGSPLRLLAGPERIESGWWDDALATRDYFIASNDAGQLLWVYRERQVLDKRDVWFLHGLFA